MTAEPEIPSYADATENAAGRSGLVHALWLVPFLAASAPTLAWLLERWTLGIWFSGQQGLFVPFIMGFLIWREFRLAPAEPACGSPLGFVLLVPGLASMSLDAVAGTGLWGAAGLVLCLPGISLLLLGTRRTRRLAFPLALGAFMLPIPGFAAAPIHLLLREISALGAASSVPWLGIPVVRQGTTLLIPAGEVAVSDACSGFATFHSLLTVALILAYLTRESLRRSLGVLVMAPVLALVTNVARVTALVVLAQWYGFELLDTWLHPFSGLVAFALSLCVLFAVAGRDAIAGPRPDYA